MSDYHELTRMMQKIKRAEGRLKTLLENKQVLEKNIKLQEVKLEKENFDVEKLEGLSLIGFVHLIKGTLIDKLDKEEKEALLAKNKYEYLCHELRFCLDEINLYRKKVEEKYIIEKEYKKCLKLKEKELVCLNNLNSKKIIFLIEKICYNNEVLLEVNEAIKAGDALYESFECINKCFEEAVELGVVDVLDNGLLVSEENQSEIQITNQAMMLIQQLIRKFHIELLDVSNIYDFNVDEEEILTFTDYFLEGIMKRKSVEEKLEMTKEKIEKSKLCIKKSMWSLRECKAILIEEIKRINEEKINLVETFLLINQEE